jgi:pyrophosphatase PpaX
MSFIGIIIVVTGFLALYWVFYGQRRYNDIFMPRRETELKAILFDFDGVIINSYEAWFNVFNDLRKKYNLKEIGRQEFDKKVWGNSLYEEAKIYFRDQDLEEVKHSYNSLRNKYSEKTILLPKVKKVLESVKKKKIKIGLVTNSFRKATLNTLKFHKISKYFDVIVTVDDVERPKPNPEPVIKACEKLDIIPQETIYVGDTKFDYKAGKAAGCLVVGLNSDGDLVIDKLSDLLKLV